MASLIETLRGLNGVPAGCEACRDGVQAGHFACLADPTPIPEWAELAGFVAREFAEGRWVFRVDERALRAFASGAQWVLDVVASEVGFYADRWYDETARALRSSLRSRPEFRKLGLRWRRRGSNSN